MMLPTAGALTPHRRSVGEPASKPGQGRLQALCLLLCLSNCSVRLGQKPLCKTINLWRRTERDGRSTPADFRFKPAKTLTLLCQTLPRFSCSHFFLKVFPIRYVIVAPGHYFGKGKNASLGKNTRGRSAAGKSPCVPGTHGPPAAATRARRLKRPHQGKRLIRNKRFAPAARLVPVEPTLTCGGG